MANSTHIPTVWITPQYHGQLITQQAPETAFLNKIGGLLIWIKAGSDR